MLIYIFMYKLYTYYRHYKHMYIYNLSLKNVSGLSRSDNFYFHCLDFDGLNLGYDLEKIIIIEIFQFTSLHYFYEGVFFCKYL